MAAPLVEIFVINYNGGQFLEPSLRSVLAQTYTNKKVILSDNQSTQNDVERCQKYVSQGLEIRVRNPGTGDCYSHYNVCLKEVKAPYVAIFHNDDLYEPQIIQKQIDFLESHPHLSGVMTGATAIGPNDETLWPILLPEGFEHPVLNPKQAYEYTLRHGSGFWVCPSVCFRSSIFEKIGLFRAELPFCADLEFWLRLLLEGGGLGYLNEPLIRYRMTLAQGSSKYEWNRVDQSEFFTTLEEYLKEFKVSEDVLQDFEALKKLDLFQAGINRLVQGHGVQFLEEQVNYFRKPSHRERMKNFGFVDRARFQLIEKAMPLLKTSAGPQIARSLFRWTDPRQSLLLNSALRLKRRFL